MGVVVPTNTSVKSFRGLHLYHAGRSNCSARARLLIVEKDLPWTSHHVNIYERENVTPEYFGINPKGLVPTLVHDGVVIVERGTVPAALEAVIMRCLEKDRLRRYQTANALAEDNELTRFSGRAPNAGSKPRSAR